MLTARGTLGIDLDRDDPTKQGKPRFPDCGKKNLEKMQPWRRGACDANLRFVKGRQVTDDMFVLRCCYGCTFAWHRLWNDHVASLVNIQKTDRKACCTSSFVWWWLWWFCLWYLSLAGCVHQDLHLKVAGHISNLKDDYGSTKWPQPTPICGCTTWSLLLAVRLYLFPASIHLSSSSRIKHLASSYSVKIICMIMTIRSYEAGSINSTSLVAFRKTVIIPFTIICHV